MNEAVRNLAVLLWAVCAMNGNSFANDGLIIREENIPTSPTVIIGKAVTPTGKMREEIVVQPENAPNPLGNPIVDEPTANTSSETTAPMTETQNEQEIPHIIKQSRQSGELSPDSVALPQPSNRIENELYQSGNDIIDVQAYPIEDVKEVTEPNIQPTIVSD